MEDILSGKIQKVDLDDPQIKKLLTPEDLLEIAEWQWQYQDGFITELQMNFEIWFLVTARILRSK